MYCWLQLKHAAASVYNEQHNPLPPPPPPHEIKLNVINHWNESQCYISVGIKISQCTENVAKYGSRAISLFFNSQGGRSPSFEVFKLDMYVGVTWICSGSVTKGSVCVCVCVGGGGSCNNTCLKPGVGNRPVITYVYLSQVDQIA